MDDAYMGSIMLFAGNYEPRNWMFCNGQILRINDYQALFSILSSVYGGDGRTTFALPDLRGRVPLHIGTGPGLTTRRLGERAGQEHVILTQNEMPEHTHQTITKLNAKEEPNIDDLSNNFIAGTGTTTFGTTADVQMNSNSVQVELENAGGSNAHNNMQPYLGLNYIICVTGLFPPRN